VIRAGHGGLDVQGVKDANGLYEVERRAYHAMRPGFRIAQLQIGSTQKVPWQAHDLNSGTAVAAQSATA
jgi:hypothetical protein